MLKRFPFIRQLDSNDCGATSIRIVAKYYGVNLSYPYLRDKCRTNRQGASLLDLSTAAQSIGFRSSYLKLSFDEITKSPLPLIVYWRQGHFVVVYKIGKKIHVSDPNVGRIKYTKEEFLQGWLSIKDNGTPQGIALLLQSTQKLKESQYNNSNLAGSISYFYDYVRPYRKYFIQIILGMFIGSMMQLIIPFLTQALVDHGIGNHDINFIYLILFAQVSLLLGRTTVQYLRSWIMLHISTRISVSLISDFIIKLVGKPLAFFSTRSVGDIMQRIGDHGRIQNFITASSLNVIFSTINFFMFSLVILYYNTVIFAVFAVGSLLYALWVIYFYEKRKELDHKRFTQSASNQNSLFQMISGIQDIKLENCEHIKRLEWQKIQAKLFAVNIDFLKLNQAQQLGAMSINEFKNIAITVIAAKMVLDGSITFGMMLSIQYMIGMLNAPINQIINLLRQYQDAKISLERLQEIHFDPNLESSKQSILSPINAIDFSSRIKIENLTFNYLENENHSTLKDVNLEIPLNKTTAIVGGSGSGKTTLIKLLLKFYKATKGTILIDGVPLEKIEDGSWRSLCGAVLPTGQIFNDNIAKNIGLSDQEVDTERLEIVTSLANLTKYVNKKPLKFETKIGNDGHGLSQGQKQRILIARALYKDPKILLLDEATSALDYRNESIVMHNIMNAYQDRGIIIASHRLSTIQKADQIVVMENGRVAGVGTHEELISTNEVYANILQYQIESG